MKTMTDMEFYLTFFHQMKELVVNLGLSQPEDLKGVSEGSIKSMERRFNFELDNSIRVYLLNFGEKMIIRNVEGATFNLNGIIQANILAEEKKISENISSCSDIIKVAYPDLESVNPVIIKYDEIGSVFVFSIKGVENSFLYYYWGDDMLDTENYNFITTIRNALFYGLLWSIKKEKIESNQIGWLNFYASHKCRVAGGELIRLRNKFCGHMSRVELREDYFFSLHHYEEEFVKFIEQIVDPL